jgi:hypothetical protein
MVGRLEFDQMQRKAVKLELAKGIAKKCGRAVLFLCYPLPLLIILCAICVTQELRLLHFPVAAIIAADFFWILVAFLATYTAFWAAVRDGRRRYPGTEMGVRRRRSGCRHFCGYDRPHPPSRCPRCAAAERN